MLTGQSQLGSFIDSIACRAVMNELSDWKSRRDTGPVHSQVIPHST
jgi:hypothetical protein